MKPVAVAAFIVFVNFQLAGQGLENIPPVIFGPVHHVADTGVCFILTPSNMIEIVDAYQPWPPRWFEDNDIYQAKQSGDSGENVKPNFRDARFQNGYFTFCQLHAFAFHNSDAKESGYVICNSELQPIDTIIGVDLPINPHDFKINRKGDKLYAAMMDTVLDMSKLTGSPGDTAINTMIDIIEVLDRNNKLVFRWNPAKPLGIDALYFPYAFIMSRASKPGFTDWSHCNGVDWDADGNILFCFRNIGVGKIARNDGHVIWSFEKRKMPYIGGSDSLLFYLQHGFENAGEKAGYDTYTLYSNGDSLHRVSYGLQFSVDKRNLEISSVKSKMPVSKIGLSIEGNYDITGHGDYILNYGLYSNSGNPGDTGKYKVFMEYGNEQGEVYAQYKFASHLDSYKVTRPEGWRPPRPGITKSAGKLLATGNMAKWVWYQICGRDNTEVKKVGEGISYTPDHPGTYCVAGKYGIGYSVSHPFEYKP